MTLSTTALRQALAAATPGPWERCPSDPSGPYIEGPGRHGGDPWVAAESVYEHNCNLIVLLRNAAPSLLDELDQLRAEVARLRDIAGRLSTWTVTCGRALCPPLGSADTFGDGMREAQRQVSNILADKRHGWKAGAAEPPRDASAGEGAR